MDVPVDIFCLLYLKKKKKRTEPYLLSPQHYHNPRWKEKSHIHFKPVQQLTAPFLPSLQRWIQHGLAWEPWTLGSIKLSFATINSRAIKQKLDSHPLPVLSSPTVHDGPGTFFPSGAIRFFLPLLLKNCLIKISRVQLHNISLGRTKP